MNATNTDSNIENIGEHYARIFSSFVQSILQYDKQINSLVEQERAIALKKEDYYLATLKAVVNPKSEIKVVAQGIIDRLVWRAQEIFAPEGASLKIHKDEVAEACGYYDKYTNWNDFDASKVWDYLVNNYGGDKGEEEGHRQTAKAIIDSFHLRSDTPIRTVNGKMILERSVYIDSFDKKWSKKNKISYNCVEGISKSIRSLIGFATWANLDLLSQSLSIALHQLGEYRGEVTSRAVYCGNGIRIITYLNRYEYQIDPNVAEQLQLFLSLYSFSDEMQEAA